jgi:nitrate reductase molybdenum cofactor assembly chaperone
MDRVELYSLFAELFNYPREGYARAAERCLAAAEDFPMGAREALRKFTESIRGKSVEQLEELFVGTFDLNPVCVLEIGWHLYGDNYDRGAFLVKLRERLRHHEIAESSELPDHLTHVLALLARLEAEEAGSFAAESVLPALDKMLAGIAGKGSPYECLLEALRKTLAGAHAPEGVSHG